MDRSNRTVAFGWLARLRSLDSMRHWKKQEQQEHPRTRVKAALDRMPSRQAMVMLPLFVRCDGRFCCRERVLLTLMPRIPRAEKQRKKTATAL